MRKLIMKNLFITLLILATLSMGANYENCLASSVYNNEFDIEVEKTKIKAVLEKLDKALQTENMELFSEVFAHDQDIIIIGPDFREKAIGWETLVKMQNRQFRDLENLTISLIDQKINIGNSGDVARYFRVLDIRFVTSNLPFRLKGIRETGVLKKENGNWVIVQQHISAPVNDQIWPFYLLKHQQESPAYDPNKKFDIETLKEDYDLLRLALEEAHAGIYRYTSKTEFDALFNTLFMDIDREMTEIEFFRLLLPIIEKIHCLHTSAWPSSNYQKVMNEKGLFFPFELKFISGKAYIFQSFDAENQIPPGSEIVSINGKPLPQLLSDLVKMLPSDGKNETYKYRTLDQSFPEKYYLYSDQPESFKIAYLAPEKKKIATIVVPGVSLDVINQCRPSFEEQYGKCLKLQIQEESNLAILTIKTFVPKIIKHFGYDYYQFLEVSFKEIEENNISNLIIDLRWNDGGESLYCTDLLAYLIDKPFRFSDCVNTPKPRYSFLEYTDKGMFFNYLHPNLWTRDSTGRYLLKGNWSEKIEPKVHNFKGKVYVLINGMSISGSADVAALLHYHNKATFIGEETGGAYYGNNSGDYINLKLPNTHIRVRIPIRSSVMAVSDYPFRERGVVPDFELKPKIEDILQGIDKDLDFAIDIIKKGNRKKSDHRLLQALFGHPQKSQRPCPFKISSRISIEPDQLLPIILFNFILVVTVLPHPDDFSAFIPFKYHFFAKGFILA